MDNRFPQNVDVYTAEDVSATVITFKNGAVAAVTGTNGGIPGKWLSAYELVAKNIVVQFASANEAKLFRTDKSPVAEETITSAIAPKKAETLDLFQAIETDGATRIPIIEGAKTLELVLAANKSGMTGEIVELE